MQSYMSKKLVLNDICDAAIWAEEWLKTIKEHPEIPTDEDTMISWFANAIMAGYDHAYRELKGKISDRFDCIINGKGLVIPRIAVKVAVDELKTL